MQLQLLNVDKINKPEWIYQISYRQDNFGLLFLIVGHIKTPKVEYTICCHPKQK